MMTVDMDEDLTAVMEPTEEAIAEVEEAIVPTDCVFDGPGDDDEGEDEDEEEERPDYDL